MSAADIEENSSGRGFFAARWRGEISAERLFYLDMLLVGTSINLAASFVSIVLLGLKFPLWVSIAAYAAPLPYNVFLLLALWRATDRRRTAGAATYRVAALCWALFASLI